LVLGLDRYLSEIELVWGQRVVWGGGVDRVRREEEPSPRG
jgi:hypothetical protein